ncbi:S8 family serine peptidase [Conexibacter sp. W3-3-2]|uniref:S8 family serine peptidase n=1 Tax=Conexibacter sp. W3-3-2 TaxID=2675227 RepID=UPI0035C88C1F
MGEARGNGVSVVAAAGNTAGAPNGWPATADGVIAVAAGTPAGGLCGYASYSPGTLVGPGCGIDTAGWRGTGDHGERWVVFGGRVRVGDRRCAAVMAPGGARLRSRAGFAPAHGPSPIARSSMSQEPSARRGSAVSLTAPPRAAPPSLGIPHRAR